MDISYVWTHHVYTILSETGKLAAYNICVETDFEAVLEKLCIL